MSKRLEWRYDLMKEILINVSKETRMVDLNKSVIGNDGENLQGKLVFTFVDEFVDGQARLEYEIKDEKNYIVLEKQKNSYTTPVKNVITKEGQIDMQLVITEGTSEEEIPVFKSNKFYLHCNSAINAVEEAPEGVDLWIEKAVCLCTYLHYTENFLSVVSESQQRNLLTFLPIADFPIGRFCRFVWLTIAIRRISHIRHLQEIHILWIWKHLQIKDL